MLLKRNGRAVAIKMRHKTPRDMSIINRSVSSTQSFLDLFINLQAIQTAYATISYLYGFNDDHFLFCLSLAMLRLKKTLERRTSLLFAISNGANFVLSAVLFGHPDPEDHYVIQRTSFMRLLCQ